jgi:hypothetical protein
VVLCLQPDVVTLRADAMASAENATGTTTIDESWFAGPPYAVAEEVFDEYSIEACSLTAEEH